MILDTSQKSQVILAAFGLCHQPTSTHPGNGERWNAEVFILAVISVQCPSHVIYRTLVNFGNAGQDEIGISTICRYAYIVRMASYRIIRYKYIHFMFTHYTYIHMYIYIYLCTFESHVHALEDTQSHS